MAPAVRKAIEKAKASLRYLPKYSPDLNPIEAALQQIQDIPAQGRGANRAGPHSRDSLVLPTTPPERMRQLFRSRRLCFKMNGIRFSVIFILHLLQLFDLRWSK